MLININCDAWNLNTPTSQRFYHVATVTVVCFNSNWFCVVLFIYFVLFEFFFSLNVHHLTGFFFYIHAVHGIKHARGITSLVYVESCLFHVNSLLQHICLGMRSLVGLQVPFCTYTNLNKWKWNLHSRCSCVNLEHFFSLQFSLFFLFISHNRCVHFCSSDVIDVLSVLNWLMTGYCFKGEDAWKTISNKMRLVANLRNTVTITCDDR